MSSFRMFVGKGFYHLLFIILTQQNHKLELTVFVIFNSSLTIFIEDNQSDSEVTKVQKIALYGST